jgi:hypothetical protein
MAPEATDVSPAKIKQFVIGQLSFVICHLSSGAIITGVNKFQMTIDQ